MSAVVPIALQIANLCDAALLYFLPRPSCVLPLPTLHGGRAVVFSTSADSLSH